MSEITSRIDSASDAYRANFSHNRGLAAELHRRVVSASLGGPEKHRQRHVARGKLLPRDRVMHLLDPARDLAHLDSIGFLRIR